MSTLLSFLSTLRHVLLAAVLLCPAQAFSAELVLGSKNFTEQRLLSPITAQYLTHMGYQVEQKIDLASVIMRNALLNRQLDLVWEYTGTALVIYDGISKRMTDKEAYETVKGLDLPRGLTWLNPSALNNSYALAMKTERARAENIRTISDLARRMSMVQATSPWQLGMDMEFAGRTDGLVPMQKLYTLPLIRSQIRQMDSGLVYNAIRDGFVDAGLVYTTDGRVKGFKLLVLKDDLAYFPIYAATPVIRNEVLLAHPQLKGLLNTLAALFNNETMIALNAEVDIDHRPVAEVATEFLRAHSLL
ncbi:glycine betaine ABC transporter substrate-binding protein [Paludibacterium yongneupense]|uniref:glycine betaine ABC transporter substrate-binding protein n=1 Tax=Paludibacterium yongneupense TaxID=400061 RepID=UPI0004273DD6|nr:glycine betaine ABC transporter substrate-binding protein [Paludibacterium yongneupense]